MKREEKWTPHIIAAAALVVFIVLGLACATTTKPLDERFSNPNVPAKEQSVLLSMKTGPAIINSIDGRNVPSQSVAYDFFLIPPGEHEVIVRYERVIYYNQGTGSYRYIESKIPFTIRVNFIPGHFYAMIGGDRWETRYRNKSSDFTYTVVDFTTQNPVVVWSSDDVWANEIAKAWSGILRSYRRDIDKLVHP